jgi:hypothetical protein
MKAYTEIYNGDLGNMQTLHPNGRRRRCVQAVLPPLLGSPDIGLLDGAELRIDQCPI